MALIICPVCGKEISDKAAKCPQCGRIFRSEESPKKYCAECGLELREKDESCPRCGCLTKIKEIHKDNNAKSNKKKIYVAIAITVIFIIVVAAFGVKIYYDKAVPKVTVKKTVQETEDYENMSEQQKIEIITQFMGREVDVNQNSISMSQELVDFMKHANLFQYYGVCTSGYSSDKTQGKVVLDTADWTSDARYSEEMFEDIVEQLTGIYGETEIEENASEDLRSEYVWKSIDDFEFVMCGINSDDKVKICWMIDDGTDNSQAAPEKLKMFTEYEGNYDEKAEAYETYATECFLKELESAEQDFAYHMGDADAIVNSEWNMSGTFVHEGDYYFCYKYLLYSGDVGSHVLIKYDSNTKEASVETPLEWMEADIEAAEAKINN